MATRIVAQLLGARRIVVWLVLTAVWAGGTLLLLTHADRPKAGRTAESAGAFPDRTGRGGVLGSGAVPDEPATAPPEIVRDLPEARRVAAAFARAYATWRFDETPDAAVARLARYATPELAARLRTAPGSGATAARQTLSQQSEFSTAVAEAVQTQRLSAEGVTLLVVVRQEVHTAAGVEVRRPSYAVRLMPAPAGSRWLVQDFTP